MFFSFSNECAEIICSSISDDIYNKGFKRNAASLKSLFANCLVALRVNYCPQNKCPDYWRKKKTMGKITWTASLGGVSDARGQRGFMKEGTSKLYFPEMCKRGRFLKGWSVISVRYWAWWPAAKFLENIDLDIDCY